MLALYTILSPWLSCSGSLKGTFFKPDQILLIKYKILDSRAILGEITSGLSQIIKSVPNYLI